MHKTERRVKMTEHTNWMAYTKLCNRININPQLTNKLDVNTEIKTLNHLMQKAYRNMT